MSRRTLWDAPEGQYDPSRELNLQLETIFDDNGHLPEFKSTSLEYGVPEDFETPPNAQPSYNDMDYVTMRGDEPYPVILSEFPPYEMFGVRMSADALNDAKAMVRAKASAKWGDVPRGLETQPHIHMGLIRTVRERKSVSLDYRIGNDVLHLYLHPIVYTTMHLFCIEFDPRDHEERMRWLVLLPHKIGNLQIYWDRVFMNRAQLKLTSYNPIPTDKLQLWNTSEPYFSVYLPETRLFVSPPNTDESSECEAD